ncbi:hypothetical protein [Kingella bonacorsii]|uniref:Uncharacterized protein n=1 Tax=Kingella bonacorsii TaxID=2796361 RepID=A0ABS1BT64_9NEIS|nr:hypothetical protein [Kingella bonacorsii]MBK0396469.1 hypothetical protein [Kingella bonacorsii]
MLIAYFSDLYFGCGLIIVCRFLLKRIFRLPHIARATGFQAACGSAIWI